MIKIAYCNVKNLDLTKAYPLVSKNRQEKIDKYRFDKNKKESAGAYLLLKKLLLTEKITNPIINTKKYGKGYVCNYDNIYFNLSHSNEMVLCAISDMEIGVDIEYIDPTIDLNIGKNYFTSREYENIINSKNQINEFFKYWVLKESYMKYTGLGMNLKLNSFEIIINKEIKLKNNIKNLKFNIFDYNNYKIAITSHYNSSKLIEYNVEDLY